MNTRTYVCIDLKSFYASVECVARGLDPFKTKLVVADPERSEKTICLAVSPALKALGVPGRCRVFEIPKNIEYIMAEPRMQKYIDVSADIYAIYLRYIAKEDIHVYSIDEVFMDVTDYLTLYDMTAKELGQRIMNDIFEETGITSTCGIGSNLYLAKIALDIWAKHVEDHIGILDEETYRDILWDHRPLTDFWRVGPGIAARLKRSGIETMREIANADEDLLYHLLGIDAELLIDHAWGRETTTMSDIKNYRPRANSLSSGQVLAADHGFDEGKLIVREMTDLLCLDLVDKGLITENVSLYLGYGGAHKGESASGSINIPVSTSSARVIIPCVDELYDRIMDKNCYIKRVGLSFNNVTDESFRQYDLFTDPAELERENRMQKAVISIKNKFGKNAILKGMNLEEGGTTIERNAQIGGHKK
ncbi:MAG: DNA repair protein [Lachnospiraceae bacterium]|nr:DNA repair protein [Lachnospiraceae bacterium]